MRFLTWVGALVAALMLGSPAGARATVGLQESAKALGYPADDCSYCHTFGREHMTKHAREAGLQSTNCIACHGSRLPLEGVELFNERGRFLRDVKKARKAKRADMMWLKDYVEAKPKPGPTPPGSDF